MLLVIHRPAWAGQHEVGGLDRTGSGSARSGAARGCDGFRKIRLRLPCHHPCKISKRASHTYFLTKDYKTRRVTKAPAC